MFLCDERSICTSLRPEPSIHATPEQEQEPLSASGPAAITLREASSWALSRRRHARLLGAGGVTVAVAALALAMAAYARHAQRLRRHS